MTKNNEASVHAQKVFAKVIAQEWNRCMKAIDREQKVYDVVIAQTQSSYYDAIAKVWGEHREAESLAIRALDEELKLIKETKDEWSMEEK